MSKLYMFITTNPDHFHIDNYTRYITTLEGFADLLCDQDFYDDYLDGYFSEITGYSLSTPDEKGYITVRINGYDWCDESYVIERGLIPVNVFK